MRTTEPAGLVEPMMAMLPSSSSPDRKSRPPGPGQSRLLSLPGGLLPILGRRRGI